MNGQKMNDFNYPWVTLERIGSLNEQKTSNKTEGYQAIVAVDWDHVRNCGVRVEWGLGEADVVHGRFCKKLIGYQIVQPVDVLKFNLT